MRAKERDYISRDERGPGVETVAVFALWLFYILWFFWFIRNGIDVSDQAYVLTKYKYFFDMSPDARSLETIMTDVVGALIYRAAPSHQALVITACGWLCYMVSGAVLYFSIKKYTARIPLLIAMIAGSFFSMTWGRYFSYNASSMLIQTVAVCVLIKALERDSNGLIFLTGLLVGANTLFRLPNILQGCFGIAIIWHCVISKMPVSRSIKRCGIGIAGIAAGWLATGAVAVKYLGMKRAADSFKQTFGMFSGTDAVHSSSNMTDNMLAGLRRGASLDIRFLVPLLVAGAAAGILCFVVKRRLFKVALSIITLAAIAVYTLRWSTLMDERTGAYDLLCMFAAAGICTFVLGTVYFIRRNSVLSSASLVFLIAELILFIGTANGLTYQMVFMIAPAAACMMIVGNIRDPILAAPVRCLSAGLVILVLVVGSKYAANYVYRDAPNPQLIHEVNAEEYAGLLTSKDRAEYLDDAQKVLEKSGEKTLLSVGYSFNSPYVISDKRPAVKRIWIDLRTYTDEAFQKDLEEGVRRDGYPAILIANRELSEANNDPNKLAIVEQFIDDNDYVRVYTDKWFTLYTPK